MNLIDLGDAGGDRCVVSVTGRYQPGVLTGHDILRGDVLVSADFIEARLELCLPQRDLDAWQHALTQLVPGKGAGIGDDRGVSLDFFLQEDRAVSLTVRDPDRLCVMLSIEPQENWIPDHLRRLGRVREAWPSEVVETSPRAYEWSPRRKR